MNKLAYVILVNYYRMLEIDILVDIFSYVVEIALFYSSTDILFMDLSFIHLLSGLHGKSREECGYLLWHEKLLYPKQTRPAFIACSTHVLSDLFWILFLACTTHKYM